MQKGLHKRGKFVFIETSKTVQVSNFVQLSKSVQASTFVYSSDYQGVSNKASSKRL